MDHQTVERYSTPFAKRVIWLKIVLRKRFKKRLNPCDKNRGKRMKRIAYMFPGQGSQAVGMGKELHDTYTKIQELYERANTLLHKDLRSIMFQGPKDTLTETENAQPALLL